MKWVEKDVIEGTICGVETMIRCGKKGDLLVILGRSPNFGWHLSLSHVHRLPMPWEVTDALEEFWPKGVPRQGTQISQVSASLIHVWEDKKLSHEEH